MSFDYRIVENSSANELAREIVHLVTKGWEPQGGVTVTNAGHTLWYAQAVIRETFISDNGE
jgi:hypothetical protein